MKHTLFCWQYLLAAVGERAHSLGNAVHRVLVKELLNVEKCGVEMTFYDHATLHGSDGKAN